MNERIRQLAIEARLEMCICGCDMPTRQSAKFAELIVKECADAAFDFWCSQGDCNENSAHDHILKHFGVER